MGNLNQSESCVEVHTGVRGGVCREVHRGAQRYTEGCMEVCGGMRRCMEVCGGIWRYVEGCMEVCGGVHEGMQRYTEGCAEVRRGMQRGVQRYAEVGKKIKILC